MILGKGRDNWMRTGIINGYLEVRRRRRREEKEEKEKDKKRRKGI